ncbi:bifunctional 4-hydroxy-2-oxoglutarate aldolase/2-dehydro-3-deoxy-phosphogluconate aldolase [Sulfobacillus harzensis]|uniref:Bifunctional 4-hydroxy-2-oxoglutarate aldolase/2-dehydro-3-deoxy-phosphogluconate aldolase n=1 Tax=Sulfobacillus harzensis TaxID=2729629 RepID=A0A7Y0L279_9FIRM|nr:bifunctional 4-hydroxy-2-oxoglutarate aldolase/2-dehydro-3-deoxy-phosphogluconate aldolase [Sulfobacillus harzensis]NMP21371.1 bifunctional 4-hydroxy-2-oxoglutarate aldolase/2-dehydro-3-deoxy-phosphogluconate aldolase [Sulfobacillus harzensis]
MTENVLAGVLGKSRVLPVIRAAKPEMALGRARTIVNAGISVVEIAWTTPEAAQVVRDMCERPGLVVGAGTILNEETAQEALDAGAEFLVAPNLSKQVARLAKRRGVPYLPGVFTADEVSRALDEGLTILKLFPAATGGVAHMRALNEPFPGITWVPTGGISWETAGEWIRAGAVAVGMGSALLKVDDLTSVIKTLQGSVA